MITEFTTIQKPIEQIYLTINSFQKMIFRKELAQLQDSINTILNTNKVVGLVITPFLGNHPTVTVYISNRKPKNKAAIITVMTFKLDFSIAGDDDFYPYLDGQSAGVVCERGEWDSIYNEFIV